MRISHIGKFADHGKIDREAGQEISPVPGDEPEAADPETGTPGDAELPAEAGE